jgi:release factor glutamine methyltransferase
MSSIVSSPQPTTHDQRVTIDSWVQNSIQKLQDAGVESARLDATILAERGLEKDRTWVLAHGDSEISPQQLKKLNDFITQRISRVPLAYIIGAKEFYGREFIVNECVLIPRPESETIIDILLNLAKNYNINTIIDIGTGSGCLAITTKKELPDAHVTGIDISETALKIAKMNARKHDAHIQWKQMDFIQEGLPNMPKTRPYVFLANLPYVPNDMITSEEITKEPALALFSGDEGLHHYRAFFNQLSQCKNKPFAVIAESLTTQHSTLAQLATQTGYNLQTTTDLIQLFILNHKI